ncbi:uncharacterized protein C8Q71DRAFT_364489 [Rhodofomes roseus]|uniref:HNH nuclease domain-containing protein n=1 Tax=Rhodofomes roseus TaxID=34475 RepID=A0ABQ8K164_9APHY|nr:uncharacterized protein C8Q71DRAFT_364489 [Rhodofomes roseus]KAH9830430.1 hypothetical protein C8Q71DRAFT_364489 [Rhodofomes roseus]
MRSKIGFRRDPGLRRRVMFLINCVNLLAVMFSSASFQALYETQRSQEDQVLNSIISTTTVLVTNAILVRYLSLLSSSSLRLLTLQREESLRDARAFDSARVDELLDDGIVDEIPRTTTTRMAVAHIMGHPSLLSQASGRRAILIRSYVTNSAFLSCLHHSSVAPSRTDSEYAALMDIRHVDRLVDTPANGVYMTITEHEYFIDPNYNSTRMLSRTYQTYRVRMLTKG